MPLGEPALAVLTAALHDPGVVARYRAKIVAVPGAQCWWWDHAISGRDTAVYVGAVSAAGAGERGRELCVIAHRFGYALVHGAAALNDVPVLTNATTRCVNGSAQVRSRRPQCGEPPRLPGAAVFGRQSVGTPGAQVQAAT